MSFLVCNSCNKTIGERSPEIDAIDECPFCGSEDLSLKLVLKDSISLHENVKGKSSKMPGKKKAASEFQAGEQKSVSLDKWVKKTRKIDRENNQYFEEVIDPDTNEIIHKCVEPLSEHFGHGSAKGK